MLENLSQSGKLDDALKFPRNKLYAYHSYLRGSIPPKKSGKFTSVESLKMLFRGVI